MVAFLGFEGFGDVGWVARGHTRRLGVLPGPPGNGAHLPSMGELAQLGG